MTQMEVKDARLDLKYLVKCSFQEAHLKHKDKCRVEKVQQTNLKHVWVHEFSSISYLELCRSCYSSFNFLNQMCDSLIFGLFFFLFFFQLMSRRKFRKLQRQEEVSQLACVGPENKLQRKEKTRAFGAQEKSNDGEHGGWGRRGARQRFRHAPVLQRGTASAFFLI